jgi:putative DNA primase/helicase
MTLHDRSNDSKPGTAAPQKPTALPVLPEGIPETLRALPRWVGWRYELAKGKWTKTPVNVWTGNHASSTDPGTWATFEQARAAYRSGGLDGIGIVLAQDGDGPALVGIDLDHCRDPRTGELQPWAQEIISGLDTYAEVTPSSCGVRAFVIGNLPPGRRKRGNVEVYSTGRYLTVTGHRLDGAAATVQQRQAELEGFHWRHLADKPATAATAKTTTALDDTELIERAGAAANGDKFRRLWGGDTSGYASHSEADLALCGLLAFWTGPDPERIDRVFRQSGLMRVKCGREDYVRRTAERALEGKTEFYSPSRRHERNGTANGTPLRPPDATAAGTREAWQVIRDYFRDRYCPDFKEGDCLYSRSERRLIRRQEACAALPPDLIEPLSTATNVPIFKPGSVNKEALPGFFRKWAATGFAALLQEVPEQAEAELGGDAPAAEEFRQLIRQALTTEFALGRTLSVQNHRSGKVEQERRIELRSLIDWCRLFAKPGPWRSIRSKQCWTKLEIRPDGECFVRIAIRHELLAQLKADPRLCRMPPKRFASLALQYGVARAGGPDERAHGRHVLIIENSLVADLLDTVPTDDEICATRETTSGQGTAAQEK